MAANDRAISIDTIRAASRRIHPVAARTPVVRLDAINRSAPEILLKLETFQPIGAFKIRGAMNAVARLSTSELKDGVWTVSAGNAAQGVALAAREAGAPASVLVMDTAPETKLDAIERLGATIVKAPYDECWSVVESGVSGTGFAASESETHPRLRGRFIHPFDDDDFISGNGTIGLEILEDVPDVDAVVVPVGGGGLVAGLGAVFRHERPTVRIYAAEPETAAPLSASLAAGRPVHLEHWTRSFVDGAGGKSVLPSMWPLLKAAVDEAIVVPLADAGAAMRRVAERVHVIMEGAAACAVAAALSPAVRARGHRRIVAIVSGGNIDLSQFASIVGACPA